MTKKMWVGGTIVVLVLPPPRQTVKFVRETVAAAPMPAASRGVNV